MIIEQMPNSTSGINGEKDKLSMMALELERTNDLTGNATDPELKEVMIQKMDNLNEKIAILEDTSGLSADEILRSYKQLNAELEKGADIKQLIKNLADELPEKKRTEFFETVKNGALDVATSMFADLGPKKMAIVTALVLALSTGAVSSINVTNAESIPKEQQIELKNKIQNPTQAWEYLLSVDQKHSLKALEKIKYALGYGKHKGLKGILNYLAGAKEMGAVAYTNSLGLNYYDLDKTGKEKVRKQFEEKLKKKGLARYFQVADSLKYEKKDKENSFLEEAKKIEDKLKTPLIKEYEPHMRQTEILGYSAFRNKYMREGLSPQETAEKIIKLMDGGARRYFEKNK